MTTGGLHHQSVATGRSGRAKTFLLGGFAWRHIPISGRVEHILVGLLVDLWHRKPMLQDSVFQPKKLYGPTLSPSSHSSELGVVQLSHSVRHLGLYWYLCAERTWLGH